MTSLDIKISTRELSEIDNLPKRLSDKRLLRVTISDFSRYIRRLYLAMIEEAISSRRYRGQWEPIDDKGYIEYLGVTPSIPILELINDAIESQRVGYNFYIRIQPKYKYPGSNLYLVDVLRAIDNGTAKFNARPIFKKIVRELNQSMISLWRGYLAMKGVE